MSEFNVEDILAEFRDAKRNLDSSSAPQKTTPKSMGATDILNSLEKKHMQVDSKPITEPMRKTAESDGKPLNQPLSKPVVKPVAEASSKPVVEPVKANASDVADIFDDYKPTEPLFSVEQLRKIEQQRKKGISASKTATGSKSLKISTKKQTLNEPLTRAILIKDSPSDNSSEKSEKIVLKSLSQFSSEGELKPVAKSEHKPVAKETPKLSPKAQGKPVVNRPATIFGDIDDAPKPKKEKAEININVSGSKSLKDKILQHRFLFEELVKRDFKKKYKRTALGMLWSVISPFLTFLIQLLVFGYLFRRGDHNYVIYLLTGNLMFHFFSDTTTTGMFSMYANAGVLSKINAPKSVFILSSNVAGVFNFLLTLLVYFGFMIFTGVSFGPHLILMIYPILCMILFNLGVTYILSALFVFFRDIQYLYSIATTLLMYLSAIFYYADSLPSNIQFVFSFNPVYRYIAYMRQLVIDATIPSLKSHIICLGFAVASLIIGYLFHKKTEKSFVYYY